MRILVTGSRDWTDREFLNKTLDDAVDMLVRDHRQEFLRDGITLVSGECPTGADKMAEQWADQHFHIEVERHPAQWRTGGSMAGYNRNDEMVELGANICCAFIMPCAKKGCPQVGKHGSHGATHCSNAAQREGILTWREVRV